MTHHRSTATILCWLLAIALVLSTLWLVWLELFVPKSISIGADLLAQEFSEQTYPGIPADERVTSTNQTYSFDGHTYSLAVEVSEPGLPYIASSSVAGRAYFLRDGQPIDRLPQTVIQRFAPNRPNEAPLLYVCVRTSVDESARNLRDVNPIAVRKHRMPALVSYIYSPHARPDIEGVGSSSRANCVPPLDMSGGAVDFEIFTNGGRTFSSARIDAHLSIGPLVGHTIAERLTMLSFYGDFEFVDQTRSRLQLPRINQSASIDGRYTMSFDKGFVREGAKQMVGIDISARGDLADQSVVVIAHPLRQYWVVSDARTELAGQFVLSGAGLVEQSVARYQIFKPRGDYSAHGDVIELTPVGGKATVYFEYNGGTWLAPYIAFTVMPAARIGDLASIGGGEPFAFATRALPVGLEGTRFPWLMWLAIALSAQLLTGLAMRRYLRKKLSPKPRAAV